MEEGLEKLEQYTTAPFDSMPIAAFHPTIGLVSLTSDTLGKEEQMIEKQEDFQSTALTATLEHDPDS
jgi:hypothetical protein